MARWKLAECNASPRDMELSRATLVDLLTQMQGVPIPPTRTMIDASDWRSRLQSNVTTSPPPAPQALAAQLAVLLAQEQISGSGVSAFLHPMTLPQLALKLPEYLKLKDLQPAIIRVADAIERGEKIGLSGDYDCDGNCSVALMRRMLRDCGVPDANVIVHIPNRAIEGYGINRDAVNDLKGQGVQLLMTLDNGTLAKKPISRAKELGMDVVVLDHHPNSATHDVPAGALVVNPNRQDETHPDKDLKALAAVGVTFLLCSGLHQELLRRGRFKRTHGSGLPEPDMANYVSLAAIATIGDVVNTKGAINRCLIAEGLKSINAGKDPAVTAFCEAANIRLPITDETIAFQIAPIINAPGRLGQSVAWEVLSQRPDASVQMVLKRLLSREANEERKRQEAAVTKEARAQAHAILSKAPDTPVLVLASDHWPEGVVGIVAGRLKEELGLPIVVCTQVEAEDKERNPGILRPRYKCSARSIKGVDIGEAFRSLADGDSAVLLKAGGHPMAAGALFETTMLEPFRRALCERLQADVAHARLTQRSPVAGVLRIDQATPALVKAIDTLGPFGEGHRKPNVMLPDVIVRDLQPSRDGRHYFFTLVPRVTAPLLAPAMLPRLKATCFHAGGTQLETLLRHAQTQPVNLLGTLALDENGQPTLRVDDAILTPGSKDKIAILETTPTSRDAFNQMGAHQSA